MTTGRWIVDTRFPQYCPQIAIDNHAHRPRRPSTFRLLAVFSATGFIIGLVDALLTLALGFSPGPSATSATTFVAICAVYLLSWGAALGAVSAGVLRLFAVAGFRGWDDDGGLWWRDFRVPARVWAAVVFAPLWTALAFVFVFQLSPLFGFSLLGNDGFLSPLAVAHVIALFGVVGVGGLAAMTIFARRTHYLGLRGFWLLGIAALAWQVFHQLYRVSYLPPTSWIHAAQIPVIVALLACSWLALRWVSRGDDGPRQKSNLAVGLAAAVVVAPLFIGAAIERASGDQMRLTLHERTALTFRLLGTTPDWAVGPKRQIRADCNLPSDMNLAPNSCPEDDDYENVDGVILVVVDTLREDRLRARRDGEPLMPNLERFADENHEFQRAWAPSASTRHSFGAMVSGRIGSVESLSDDGHRLLGDTLEEANIWRGAIPAHGHIEELGQGFDYVDTSIIDRDDLRFAVTGGDVTDSALRALDEAPDDQPYFLMVHYFDPHAYYVSHDDYGFGWSDEARYDAEVAYTDDQLGRFFDAIDESRADDDVAVIVTSDHGEEFFDHRYSRHGVRLYEDSTRIPLIVDTPFDFDCALCQTPVSLVDLAPTIVSLFGAEADDYTAAGATCLHGHGFSETRPLFMRAANRRGLVYDSYKFIEVQNTGIRQLYDIDGDPHERINLADEELRRVDELSCVLKRRWH